MIQYTKPEEERSASVAIIGGGPAGLSAANALSQQGWKCKIFDSGKLLADRRHNLADDLGVGVGGAGLFSDGKFSYYPSGTQLYELSNHILLKRAYSWCDDLLSALGIGTEPFPIINKEAQPFVNGIKNYPSHYATLQQRREVIREMCKPVSSEIFANCQVVAVDYKNDGYNVVYRCSDGQHKEERFCALILATGRFGGADLANKIPSLDLPLVPQRYEFGIRIDAPSRLGFLRKLHQPDVKRIWKFNNVEIRTFCTCRNGELWRIPVGQFAALSGRSDGPPTQFSNFGLLARFEGKNLSVGKEAWNHILPFVKSDQNAFFEPLLSFLSPEPSDYVQSSGEFHRPWYPKEKFERGSIRNFLNEPLYKILSEALKGLLEWAPDLADPETMCLFPAVEGVGDYPNIDSSLKVPNQEIWCCGDTVGQFRGLIPCMISGYYAGIEASEYLRS